MFRPLSALTVFTSFLVMTGPAASALPWPGGSATDIGGGLPSNFEASGIVWDNFTGALWVVGDEGQLSRMLRDGTSTANWSLPTPVDFESVTVTGTTQRIYLGKEYPPTILEYKSSSTAKPTSTGSSWQLGFPATSSNGMEGLTWVPNGYHPYANSSSGGVFFASSQTNGKIYVYDVDLSTSGSTAFRGSFTPDASHDISDLFFSTDTSTLFVLYDTANKVLEIDTSTTSFSIMRFYTLPSTTTGQEGVTLLPQCPGAETIIYIADDEEETVYSFNDFPQPCS